nr:unnamed protein product [Callosobruchus analis]
MVLTNVRISLIVLGRLTATTSLCKLQKTVVVTISTIKGPTVLFCRPSQRRSVGGAEGAARPGRQPVAGVAGCWPSSMTDEVRTLLVCRGSDSVQHTDSKFANVVRSGSSTKGGTRKLTKEWFI